ncbi:tail fiber domain-containing protein [Pseudomonas frederiksbergensis]|uniref:tail fiber domain-containing protein n=1 Tax=Pseudomonas frederiksbergensis TaxID=104087 RepID=UPI003D2151B2
MPWLRGGTVAVTNGSTTVVGTNADFAANSRIGDAFIGPDGINYEIGNVASATVISIIPAYKGPTASGVAYAIMPVQGYPKALADAFNNINLQWGPKLAALGTTGNYEILPLSKGGTGGTDQATARTGLGLGTVSTENTVPLAKGGTGGTTPTEALTGLGLKGGGNDLLIKSIGQRGAPVGYNAQGFYSGWNGNGLGETDFICNKGSGAGGFYFWSVNANNTASGPIMTYSYDGLLSVSTLAVTGSPIPISSGGTGGNTLTTARNALQLGINDSPSFLGLELSSASPYIDFHFASSAADYTSRIQAINGSTLSLNNDWAPRSTVCRAGINAAAGTTRYNFNWTGSAMDCWIDATYVGSITLFTSDYRIKKLVKDVAVPSFLDRIDGYRIVTYQKKVFGDVFRGDGTVYQGLIAHEAQAVNPLAVSGEKDAMNEDGQPIIQQLDPMALITDLMGALKELRSEVNALKSSAATPAAA